ncbi:hypothetical protein DH2020_022395 [Rehmannia glutinosa]|uniref:Pentatricopeptide repeat-containing protein n=1 Tax=Rehmannia glutinosa TaxID=99300 RepID=A0ABR0WHG2_REHGL
MARIRPFLRVEQFNRLLSRVVNLKEYKSAIYLFKDICDLGISVDEYTMTIAINCYCLSNRVDYGFSLLGWFFKRGCVPDVFTFNTLLKGLFRENKINEAQELFRKMVREGFCQLNVVTYGIVIDGLCKAGNTAMAIELLRVMEKGSYSALKLFNEMSEKGITPDNFTYNALISGFCNLSRWREVKMLFKEMIDCNLYPDVVTFSTLVDALCKEGLMDEAEDVLHLMMERNVVPYVVSYNALMDGYCLQGRVDKARNVFYSMASKNIAPDIHSFNTLINGYCKKMKIDDAMHILREMHRKGFKPDVATYSTILQGLFRSVDVLLHWRFLTSCKLMLSKRVIDEAKDFLLKMEQASLLRMGLPTTLLFKDFWGGEYDVAAEFLEEMDAKGFSPDSSTFTLLLDSLGMRGNKILLFLKKMLPQLQNLLYGDKSMIHVEEMNKLSKLKAVVCSIGLFHAGRCSTALELFDELQVVGLKPDFHTYCNMLDGLCRNDQPERAFLLLEATEQKGEHLHIAY